MGTFLCSCSAKPPPTPSWDFGADGIHINYRADKKLNLVDEKSHTLLIVIYQLNNVNVFNQLSNNKDGLQKLLGNQNFDASVMASEKFFIEPGESKKIILDRAENARWVGIVAGYYELVPKKTSLLFNIPYKVVEQGLLFKKYTADIEPLSIDLIFNSQALREKKIKK